MSGKKIFLIGGAAAALAVAAVILGLALGRGGKEACKGIAAEYFHAVEQADKEKIISMSVFGLPGVYDQTERQKLLDKMDEVLEELGDGVAVEYTILGTGRKTIAQRIAPLRSRRLLAVDVEYRARGTEGSYSGVGSLDFMKVKGRWYIAGDPPSFFFKTIK